jgi:hypothetical protein
MVIVGVIVSVGITKGVGLGTAVFFIAAFVVVGLKTVMVGVGVRAVGEQALNTIKPRQ